MVGHIFCKKQYLLFCLGVVIVSLVWGVGATYAKSGVDTASNVSTRSCSNAQTCGGSYKTTGFQSGSGAVVSYTQSTTTGATNYMTFSHNVRSQYINPYDFQVERTLGGSAGFTGNGFSIRGESSGRSNGGTGGTFTGTARTTSSSRTVVVNGVTYYIANGSYSDGSTDPNCTTCDNYVLRDFYTITFSVAGTYKFCEKISITEGLAEGTSTQSCVSFNVSSSGGGGTPTPTPDPDYYTLKAYAVDENGNYTTPAGRKVMASTTVEEGSSATVTRKQYTGWTFMCWKKSPTNNCMSTSASYRVSKLTSNTTVYAVYAEDSVVEKIKISAYSYGVDRVMLTGVPFSSAEAESGDWAQVESPSEFRGLPFLCWIHLDNKDVCLGDGYGTDDYGRYRVNGLKYSRIMNDSCPGLGTLWSSCDYAVGAVYGEEGPTYDLSATLEIRASGNDGATFSDDNIYVKPGDKVAFQALYYPAPQEVYNSVFRTLKVDGVQKINNTNGLTIGQLSLALGASVEGVSNWKNAFAFIVNDSSSPLAGLSENYLYNSGDTTRKVQRTTKSYEIKASDVGKEFEEMVKTNINNTIKTTPSKVEVSGSTIDIITAGLSDAIKVRVPYNFETDMMIGVDENKVVYAGETTNVPYTISVLERANETLNSTYATKIDNARWKFITYKGEEKAENKNWSGNDDSLCGWFGLNKGSDCEYSEEGTGTLNPGAQSKDPISISVLDIPAGESICFAVAMYPSNSGGDLNMNPNGSNTWHISKSKCFKVAKKPSIQIWGGNVFSNGKISVPVSNKKHLAGYPDNNYAFGSWTELGLIANGPVTGLASGAGMGYAEINNNGDLSPAYHPNDGLGNNGQGLAPGGWSGTNYNYCNISTLSFANDGCNNSSVGNLGNMTFSDRSNLINNLMNDNIEQRISNMINVAPVFSEDKKTILIRPDDNIPATSDITISSDIKYTGPYNSLSDVPKLFIYAKNIKINCSVTRIDAVLIAEDVINTCADVDEDDVNSELRSNQLIINGTIITNKLLANRTYGAATGANSIIPAEIINYDSTLYLWGQNNVNLLNVGRLETIYQRELAPRY